MPKSLLIFEEALLMSKKNLDRKGRFRNKIVSVRMSEEEAKLLDRRVLLSGLTKQDYIINSILDKEIAVYGSPYVFRSLHDELVHFAKLYEHQLILMMRK